MDIGVRKEPRAGERRVALVPDAVAQVVADGHAVLVERGAGLSAGLADAAYEAAGARLVDGTAARRADVLLCVRGPVGDERDALAAGTAVIGFLDPLGDPAGVRDLAARGAAGLAMELVPRITRAQSMDALSSQATVAGYEAVVVAAARLPRLFPLLMTAAGTVRPVQVLVLGAGVAGLQAIATARRLGGVVSAFDTRAVVKEQVESLGARFLSIDVGDAEGAGGYAVELDEEAHRREQELVADAVAASDVVVTTAQIPGRPAPRLITTAAVERMAAGSVVVDLAADTGGNCELTRAGEEVEHAGVRIVGAGDLPSRAPATASALYARNLVTVVRHLAPDGALVLDPEDEITRGVLVCRDGEIVNEAVRGRLATDA